MDSENLTTTNLNPEGNEMTKKENQTGTADNDAYTKQLRKCELIDQLRELVQVQRGYISISALRPHVFICQQQALKDIKKRIDFLEELIKESDTR